MRGRVGTAAARETSALRGTPAGGPGKAANFMSRSGLRRRRATTAFALARSVPLIATFSTNFSLQSGETP